MGLHHPVVMHTSPVTCIHTHTHTHTLRFTAV